MKRVYQLGTVSTAQEWILESISHMDMTFSSFLCPRCCESDVILNGRERRNGF